MRVLLFGCFIALLTLIGSSLHAQQLKLTTTQFIGGTHRYSLIYDAISTQDKGIIACGITFDSGTGDIPHIPHPNDNGDILLIKLDSFGNKQWVKTYGTTAPEGSKGICQTADGGYALLTGSRARLGDIAFDRIDANGNLLWTSRNFGSSRPEGIYDIISTPDNGLLIFGTSLGADGDIPFNYKSPPIAFQPSDWVLLKTDSLGNKQWLKVLGTSDDESFGHGTVLCDGKYYYMLASAKTKDHDCIDSVRLAQGFTGYSPYIIKLDGLGNVLWSKAYGGGSMAKAIFDSRDSTIVGVGTGGNSYEFQGNHGDVDMFLFKVDRDGNFKWAHQYGDQSSDLGKAVTIGPNKGYYISGTSNQLGRSTTYKHIGHDDGWLFLTDSLGNIIAQNLFGSTNDEGVYAVLPIKEGVAVVGNSDGFQFTEGTTQGYPFYPDNPYVVHFQLWPLSVNNIAQPAAFKSYPNPASQDATIRWSSVNASATGLLTITTLDGKAIYTHHKPIGETQLVIPTINWAKGIYMVHFISANGSSTQKLIIQ